MHVSVRPIRRVATLAVGQELLGTDRLDTNSLWIAARLEESGVSLHEKQVCGDRQEDIEERMADLLARHDLVLVTGGLGPTADDRTKEAAAALLGRALVREEALVHSMKARFAKRGIEMPEINLKQADLIEGTIPLHNPRGTAPGFLLELGDKVMVLMPGVPLEMELMMSDEVLPRLAPRLTGGRLSRRILRVAGMAESLVETMVAPVYARHPDLEFTILAAPGDIQIRWAVAGEGDGSRARLDEVEEDFRKVLGHAVYGIDDATLEGALVALLAERGETLATVESCTGGLVSKRLTDVSGSSFVFLGGLVTYSNESKERDASVPAELIAAHGAVSKEVAIALARGTRARFGATHAVAVTGIAGPDGGSAEKPIGTVHVAVASPDGEEHRHLTLPGDRTMVRSQSATAALDLLRKRLGRGSSGAPNRS